MVAISSVLSVLVGVSLGVFVTRPAGADFYDVVADLASFGQTFPPIAVFVLAVPILGFGFQPTVLALTLYGVLPVLFNTIAGHPLAAARRRRERRGHGDASAAGPVARRAAAWRRPSSSRACGSRSS